METIIKNASLILLFATYFYGFVCLFCKRGPDAERFFKKMSIIVLCELLFVLAVFSIL